MPLVKHQQHLHADHCSIKEAIKMAQKVKASLSELNPWKPGLES